MQIDYERIRKTMHKRMAAAICIAAFAMSAAAQTGTVPLDAGTPPSGLTNSNITELNGNVGIGTTNPLTKLHVNNGTNRNFLVTTDANQLGTAGTAIGSFNDGATAYAPLSILGSTISMNGSVGIGTTNPGYTLDVAGQVHSSTGYVFPDGTTQATAFIPANCGADYAESVGVTGDRTAYEPGDVLVIDPNAPGKFLKSNQAYSTLVAGIYSTKPGFVGRLEPASAKTDATEVPMAMVGRVPTKVSAENGPIKVGDLLVSSSTVGYAMKGTDRSQMLGAVIGKALGSLDSGTGVIMVLVNVQ
jgi:hypothetical protein